jgi:ABC-type multidrug transport system ATPase subunit
MALMGPSGCGKTTLLNLLARRSPTSNAKVSGHTMVGGSDIDNSSFKRISSYVEQEDTLIGSLTVEETLKFSAELSLPRYVKIFLQVLLNYKIIKFE